MHGQAREPRQDRKVATVTTTSQCRGVPGHLLGNMTIPSTFAASGWFRLLLVFTLMLKLSSTGLCAEAGPFRYARMGVANGCLVESIAFGDALRERFGEDVWYRVLQWGAEADAEVVAGHAVVVFELGGQLWSYDINRGFTRLETPAEARENFARVAKETTAPYLGKIKPYFPLYLHDLPQPPAAAGPRPYDDVSNPEFRDAGIVAERLSVHRPVALVEFTYPKDGVEQPGAVVVFVSSGRLCVYSPPKGTVPFRTRMLSLENLRQLQELLRRIYPGAGNLKKR